MLPFPGLPSALLCAVVLSVQFSCVITGEGKIIAMDRMFGSLPNPHVEVLILNAVVFGGGAFGRYGGREGGALLNGISALVRRRESDAVSHPVRREQEGNHLQMESGSSGDTESAVTLNLNIPTSRTVRNKPLEPKPPTLWDLLEQCLLTQTAVM